MKLEEVDRSWTREESIKFRKVKIIWLVHVQLVDNDTVADVCALLSAL